MKQHTHLLHHHSNLPVRGLRLSDRCVILLMFLLPVPSFVGEAAARSADAIRFGSVSTQLLRSSQLPWGRHVVRISTILLSMFGFACLSMICGVSHSLRDLLDVMRIAAFWTVFLFGASLAWRGRSNPVVAGISCLRLLLAIGLLNALFTLCQYLFPHVTRPFQEWFASGDTHIDLLSQSWRAFGFFVSPNTNAVMLLLLSLPGLTLFHLTKNKRYLVLGLFVFACVLLTASRTGLIIACTVVGVVCIASRKPMYLAAYAVIAWGAYEALEFVVVTGTMKDWFPYLSGLLIEIRQSVHGDRFDIASINSYSARLEIWDDVLEWFYDNPLLGAGPLRDVAPSIADNYYVYQLSRYGIVGLIVYALFSLYVAGLSIIAILSTRRPQKEWGILMLASVVIVNVANYTMDAFLSVPIGTLILLYAGYLACLLEMSPFSLNKHRSWSRDRVRAPAHFVRK